MPASSQLQSVAVVARVLGLSERQVFDLARRGVIPREAPGRYDLFAVVRAYLQHLREVAAGRGSQDGTLDLVAERARLAREQADGHAMKNALLRAELVQAGDAEAASIAVNSAVQQRLLALPATVAPLVATEHETRRCEAIIRRHIEEALEQIANAEIVVTYQADDPAPGRRANRAR